MKYANAAAVVCLTIAAAIMPTVKPAIADWAEQNIKVIDGPYAGSNYDLSITPYIREILEHVDPGHPCNEVDTRKSAQTGLSTVMIIAAGFMAKHYPANLMLIQPTDGDARDFAKGKFQPMVDASKDLKTLFKAEKSGVGGGSTVLTKNFPGGYLILNGAGSPSGLSSKTIRFGLYDEVDRWPAEVGDDGDPEDIADARMTAYLLTGDYKKFKISTPLIKGSSRIDDGFLAGDQRYYNVKCPHCDHEFKFDFDRDKRLFHFNTTAPYEPHFICGHSECGDIIDEHHKKKMVANGRWIAQNPEGSHPSFHVDVFISPFVPWEEIVKKFLKAKDNPTKLKAFYNLYLGLPWEVRGDAPEWERLITLREEYKIGVMPPGVLVITCAVDVQKDGLYYETIGWGRGMENWSLDYGYIESSFPGCTADHNDICWKRLDDLYERRYEDQYGRMHEIDAMGVDSGYNTNIVYNWTRRKPKAHAVDGRDGWSHPAVGLPSKVDVTWSGKRLKRGATLWPVGTWSLKANLYANLRKQGIREGQEINPPGYCHFSMSHEESFFKQLTSEVLTDVQRKGRIRREWKAFGPNHLHDTRIYNIAMAEKLGLSSFTSDDFSKLEQARGLAPAAGQKELFSDDLKEREALPEEPAVPVVSRRSKSSFMGG